MRSSSTTAAILVYLLKWTTVIALSWIYYHPEFNHLELKGIWVQLAALGLVILIFFARQVFHFRMWMFSSTYNVLSP